MGILSLMKQISAYLLLFLIFVANAQAQIVERFEHLNTQDGLSQNSVQSIFCDSKGYLWLGTWNGLNRYNGSEFEIFKVQDDFENSLTHNRISKIWEDSLNILWVKTYDGYYHYFIAATEEFITLPYYLKSLEEKNSIISDFSQTAKDEIWLGSTNSGAYYLKFDSTTYRYQVQQFISRGKSTISNNSVTFIAPDSRKNIWIGSDQGLNFLPADELGKDQPVFNHLYVNTHFTCAGELNQDVYFGTSKNGIIKYSFTSRTFDDDFKDFEVLKGLTITLLQKTSDNQMIIGTKNHGLYLYNPTRRSLDQYLSTKTITRTYEDEFGKIWINTNEFGIYQLDPTDWSINKYTLSNPGMTMVDAERQYIYEDSKQNLWIGLHGGLALYVREEDRFEIYRNDPGDPFSISSNIVYCITEDQSGLLWVGTGQPNGGVDKIITVNPAFKQVSPAQQFSNNSAYVFRSLFQDKKGYVWAGTKFGYIYIISPENQDQENFNAAALQQSFYLGSNAYGMMQDEEGYLWIASKGGGLYVSKKSLNDYPSYDQISFNNYRFHPDDSLSLSSNNVYAVFQDREKQVWIGTYGGGLNLASGDKSSLQFERINSSNSNLSSDDVRQIYEDTENRLWIATAFGLNLLEERHSAHYGFSNFFYNPDDDNSLSYNDVIHIYEDRKQQVWFTTLGGGINKLLYAEADTLAVKRLNQEDGLVNDAVFSVLEDDFGYLWFSTEKGISRMNPQNYTFENFDKNNGLFNENFTENTSCAVGENLLFGGTEGILLINPRNLNKSSFKPAVVLTNFQISNKDVDFRQPDAVINSHIESLKDITLKYDQSSFSFEYAALSYFAPAKNQYQFKLENFDEEWNVVGNQQKATYTNLTPGKYEFKVKAANWDGTWNENPRSLSIVITPPWWQTWWAYLAYVILAAGIISLIWKSYGRYHQLQNDLKVEKRVNDIKLRFFTNISHEIRTPLTLILGPIDDIKAASNIPAGISEQISIMERNGKRMLRLVNQLLDFRKIQQSKMKLMVQKIELNSFIRDIVENFLPLAEHKNIQLHFTPDGKESSLWTDPNKFDSVIFNILSNAIKFTSTGKNINVSINHISDNFIDIIIQDEGMGIPQEKTHLLFQRFSALSDDKEGMNSGIGLSLAYEIVKLHKGDILVESEPGKGCCFTIRMQKGIDHFDSRQVEILEDETREVIHQEVLFESLQHENPDEEDKAGKPIHKVLLVEDNPEIIEYLQSCLQNNYQIATASNGREGLQKLHTFHPDLIITDVMMPEMDGVEMTRKIKENIDSSHIPVVMLTAKSNMQDQITGVESGAEAYILKPFNAIYLRAVINNILKNRKQVSKRLINEEKVEVTPNQISITSKDEKFLQDVMKIIEENYEDAEFNVEKLVELSYVSRTVFYNKIKGLTGLSPIEFLRQVRIKIAGQLLVDSDYNISEIAFMAGYNNVKYFRQHFKAIFGITPNEYKSRHQTNGNGNGNGKTPEIKVDVKSK